MIVSMKRRRGSSVRVHRAACAALAIALCVSGWCVNASGVVGAQEPAPRDARPLAAARSQAAVVRPRNS